MLIFVVALDNITSLFPLLDQLHWAIEDLKLASKDSADIRYRKNTIQFEAAGTLALFTASEFVVCWKLSWLCDCWELDIIWPLLLAGGAVICWAFWD